MAILNNIEAINSALSQLLETDKRTILYGEDCGQEGGVFRTTQGLQAKFGSDRVFDAPIAEAAIAGTAIGAAIGGMKPIVEMQFSGFSYPAFQQIFTMAARYRNRSRGNVSIPVIIRMPVGGGVKALEHHSEALEALFSHVPGLKVLFPSNPYDAKGLLIAAFKQNDPVIFMEHKKIYRAFKQEVPENLYEVEIGKARTLIPGNDLTIVTYGATVHDCLKAVEILKTKAPGKTIELIDLRTICPLDFDAVTNSVLKTGRLLVVHEAVKSFSVSAELIARVNEKAFTSLMAPPERLTGWDITVPLARGEGYQTISADRVVDKALKVLNYKP